MPPWGGRAEPWAGPSGPWAGPAGGPRRGRQARRGHARAAILALLGEQRMNGYQIIQEIAKRSGGAWQPGPGAIYPTLQQLEDEGLVRAEEDAGRRDYVLTDEGRAYLEGHPEEVAAPWMAMSAADDGEHALRPLIGQVASAMWQILASGSPEQQAQTREALVQLRRRLYAILSDDDKGE
ncbi:PadR family transcriptional regulator [Microlunatus panaciterrae]